MEEKKRLTHRERIKIPQFLGSHTIRANNFYDSIAIDFKISGRYMAISNYKNHHEQRSPKLVPRFFFSSKILYGNALVV